MGLATDLLGLLQLLADSHIQNALLQTPQGAAAAGAAAGALRAFATADDERPPASKAFLHSRLLAGQPNNALQVLLSVMKQLQQLQPRPLGPLIAVLGAVRQVCVCRLPLQGCTAGSSVGEVHFPTCSLCSAKLW